MYIFVPPNNLRLNNQVVLGIMFQLGAIYIWVYVYNIVRISSSKISERETQLADRPDHRANGHESINGVPTTHNIDTESRLPSREQEEPSVPSVSI